MKLLFLVTFCLPIFAVKTTSSLEKSVLGNWKLNSVTCDGVDQPLDKDYSLSFNHGTGEYVSKTKECTQIEPEIYQYLSNTKISIKQGIRVCTPSPCAADLPASECGKETNPKVPVFDVSFADAKKTLILSTNDPNAIDCTGPKQKKPAVFKLSKLLK